MRDQKIYSTKTVHSLQYYLRVFTLLIAGLTANLSHADIAQRLNGEGISSPTGRDWHGPMVKQTLKKLRLPKEYPSHAHTALLELIVSGQMTVEQAAPLYERRVM